MTRPLLFANHRKCKQLWLATKYTISTTMTTSGAAPSTRTLSWMVDFPQLECRKSNIPEWTMSSQHTSLLSKSPSPMVWKRDLRASLLSLDLRRQFPGEPKLWKSTQLNHQAYSPWKTCSVTGLMMWTMMFTTQEMVYRQHSHLFTTLVQKMRMDILQPRITTSVAGTTPTRSRPTGLEPSLPRSVILESQNVQKATCMAVKAYPLPLCKISSETFSVFSKF